MDTQVPSMSLYVDKNYQPYVTCYTKYSSLLNENVSKEEFIREYRQFCDAEWKEIGLYLVILNAIEIAIMKGEMITLTKLNTFIAYMKDIQNKSKLRNFYNSMGNVMRNTNPIILACKHNKVGILKCVLSSEILNNLTPNIEGNAITFNDEDESCHNAFYYSVRSNNVELLDTLINKWPGGYLAAHSLELDETLSNVYRELQLKNVPLSNEMHIYVENKLIELRFFSDDRRLQSQIVNNNFGNIKERIHLVTEYVSRLVDDYSGAKRVDEKFLFLMKSVAQNIHILKQQLKSTYDTIPWEEMEFYLTSFISSHMEKREINFFHWVTLNKSKVLRYLKDFIKVLENVGEYAFFTDLPKEERKIIIARIICIYPEFQELYADHRQIRDVYSLYKMNDYIKLALSVDTKQREGQMTILRALQVIGDCLKNTLESPKLSNFSSKLLLLTFSENTRKIVIDLRDSLSHADSLAVRIRIEETSDVKFFVDVQDDMKEIGAMIDSLLRKRRIEIMEMLLMKIIECESSKEIGEVVEVFNATEFNLTTNDFGNLKTGDLEVLIKELDNTITDKTEIAKECVHWILEAIKTMKRFRESEKIDYLKPFHTLKCVSLLFSNRDKIDDNTVKYMKSNAEEALKFINLLADPCGLIAIAEQLQLLLSSIKLRIRNDDSDLKLRRIICKIFHLTQYGIDAIVRLLATLKNKGPFKGITSSKETYDALLTRKISELKYILSGNAFTSNSIKNMSAYKNNKILQSVIEILVLDILDSADDYLEHNLFFWDDSSPMLTGKCLRDHLAHDITLVNALISDPSTMVALNAKKLVSEDVIKSKEKLGRRMKDNCLKLRDKYDQGLTIIIAQEKMFAALEEGRVDDFRSYLQEGADVYGRNYNLWTALHFAAAGSNVEIVNLVIDYGVNINVKDVEGQSPLHIAAANGRTNIVKFFIELLHIDVNIMDNCQRTPLHVAVENNHQHTVEILLANNAKMDIQDIGGNIPLHYAVRNNYIDIVKILIQKGANINISGMFTPFHTAVESGHIELVNLFIANKADVRARTDKDLTPLHLAALSGHLDVVQSLVSNGADVNTKVTGSCTSLHYAVENGHEAVAEFLLAHGANPNVTNETHSITALHYAARHGYKKIVWTLLANKADPNIMTTTKMTPLHFAAKSGHLDVVLNLIMYRAEVNAENVLSATPLYYAAREGHKDIVQLMIKNGANVNAVTNGFAPLYAAAEAKQEEVVNLLVQNMAEVNLPDERGMTALHFAASSPSNEKVIKFLRKNKALVNVKNSSGVTPLHMAASAGCVRNVSRLIKYKADVNAVTKKNETPLYLAVSKGHKETVTLLIEHKAEVNTDGEVLRPLLVAVTYGHKEIIEILLKHGAHVNVRYPDQNTILHVAVRTGCINIVDALISKGADVNAVYGSNITPLHVAAEEGHDKVVELLVNKGATINVESLKVKTPLHLAVKMGHSNIVKYLLDKGATIGYNDKDNRSLLVLAVTHDHLEVVQTLLEYKGFDLNFGYNDSKLLHIASQTSNLQMVKYLIGKGADVHGKNLSLSKAIHVKGNKYVIEYFRSKGLSVNELDVHAKTPLHYAVQENRLDVVQCLIDQGADVNAKSNKSRTPLHIVATTKFENIIQLLLENGAMYNCADRSNKLPSENTDDEHIVKLLTVNKQLFKAVERNDANSTGKNIEAGAVVNVTDANNVTPLHYAARKAMIQLPIFY